MPEEVQMGAAEGQAEGVRWAEPGEAAAYLS